jgi:glyoxylase-like metal-dependent hydrolase (beta-lactamase superfamily II)
VQHGSWKGTGLDQITPRLRRILGPNPGPMTGRGTNTYILGRERVAVLDPGPALDVHLAAIIAALRPGEAVGHILVTHTHLDHSALAPALVRATGAVTVGFGPQGAGQSAVMQALAAAGLPDGGEGIDRQFVPDLVLVDGQTLAGDDWQVQALHTAGHAANHLCYAMGDLLFSGDHVMGWSTSLISPPDGDMAAYMASLARLQARDWSIAYPGHGDAIPDVPARLATLIAHRRTREGAILAALTADGLRLSALTARLYTDIPPALLPAAQRNVLAHIIDLQARNLIHVEGLTTADPQVRHC